MREFFKGWKRQAGLTALALALAMTAEWMRSYQCATPLGKDYPTEGLAIWVSWSGNITRILISPAPNSDELVNRIVIGTVGVVVEGDPNNVTFYDIPYWCLILPVTLLSAFLMLSKRRSIEPPKDQP